MNCVSGLSPQIFGISRIPSSFLNCLHSVEHMLFSRSCKFLPSVAIWMSCISSPHFRVGLPTIWLLVYPRHLPFSLTQELSLTCFFWPLLFTWSSFIRIHPNSTSLLLAAGEPRLVRKWGRGMGRGKQPLCHTTGEVITSPGTEVWMNGI